MTYEVIVIVLMGEGVRNEGCLKGVGFALAHLALGFEVCFQELKACDLGVFICVSKCHA